MATPQHPDLHLDMDGEVAVVDALAGLAAHLGSQLREAQLGGAQGREVEGPVHHGKEGPLAASLYLKDAGSNFVEFCVVR